MIDTDVLSYTFYHLFTEFFYRESLHSTDKFDSLESMWAQEYIFGILAKW